MRKEILSVICGSKSVLIYAKALLQSPRLTNDLLRSQVTSYNTISTETWRICLPEDWVEKESSTEGSHYFESPDGQQGFYISCWQFDSEKYEFSNSKAAEHVRRIERKSFLEMEGNWKIMTDETLQVVDVETSLVDAYEEQKLYRIACKVIASLPWVVRSSLHDYYCQNWAKSCERFQTIIDSIEIHSQNIGRT